MYTTAFSQLAKTINKQNKGELSLKKDISIIQISLKEIQKVIYDSQKKFKIIYFFKKDCPFSEAFDPELNKLYLKDTTNVDLFIINPGSKKSIYKLKNYLFYYGYYFPTYVVTGSGYKNIVNTLCPKCNEKIMGYSDFFILDSNNILLEQSTYNDAMQHKIDVLKKYFY
jgi:hypothetical protein